MEERWKAESEGAVWDARAETDIGVFILRYLCENRAPTGSRYAGDLASWGCRLRHHGLTSLRALGARSLRGL